MIHDHDHEPPLTPGLMATLRDDVPSGALQDRTVRALRDAGVFDRGLAIDPSSGRAGVEGRGAGRPAAMRDEMPPSTPAVIPTGGQVRRAIAAVLLFAAGLGVGLGLGTWRGHAASLTAAGAKPSDAAVAAEIRAAARDYVAALAFADADSGAAHVAALASFRSVAGQMARIAPNDRLGLAARYALFDSSHVSPVMRQNRAGGLLWY